MGEFSEQRRGFGGRSLIVTVMSESQIFGEYSGDKQYAGRGWLNDILNRALKDPSFTHIRLLDEYGTTIFGRTQLEEVEPELTRFRDFTTLRGREGGA
jgi:hypothetical protein